MTKHKLFHLGIMLAIVSSIEWLPGQNVSDYYTIENIPTPPGLDPQVGGLDVMPDGRLVACFHRGEVLTWNPQTQEWRLFAEGLQEPLGVVATSNHEVIVMQRCELTQLQDLDQDGLAESYKTLWDGFGMSGNYHEFAFGPVRDPDGNFIVSLNLASSGASVRPEVRGEFIDIGLPREDFHRKPWSQVSQAAGRMYSRVPWRGWVMRVTPEGVATPVASGFRSPNGMGYDLDGNLFVTDNQGDWIGTSKCYHVQDGRFYGHPASLVWKEGWDRDPLKVPVEELNAMRTRASFLFPQGEVANSPTQPLCDTTAGRFGPFAGQMMVGEMNVARILRLVPDRVQGVIQGAVINWMDSGGLRIGINRLVFSPDASLYIGQTALSWAGDKGIQRIRWNGNVPHEIHCIRAQKDGFSITMTQPIRAASLDSLKSSVVSWSYLYHAAYGSPKVDARDIPIISRSLSADGKTIKLVLGELRENAIHQIDVQGLVSMDGSAVLNPLATYFMAVKP